MTRIFRGCVVGNVMVLLLVLSVECCPGCLLCGIWQIKKVWKKLSVNNYRAVEQPSKK
jgi:hypothetical protein